MVFNNNLWFKFKVWLRGLCLVAHAWCGCDDHDVAFPWRRLFTVDDDDDDDYVLRNSSTIKSQPSRPKLVARLEISLSSPALPAGGGGAAAAGTKLGGKPWKRC